MIHLYALARAAVDPRVAGVAAAPVVTVEAAGLHAVVSHHDAAVRATADAALAHVTVIEALAEHTDVLPVRFGPGHTDVAALTTELERVRPRLHTLLDRVAGHVEFVVRAAGPPAPVAAGAGRNEVEHTAQGSGRAYLEGRRAAVLEMAEREEALRDRLRSTTEPLASAAAAVRDTTGRSGSERCFLVPRPAAPAFAAQARQLAESGGDLVVGGPWPPFTFSSLPPHTQAAE